MLPFTELQKWKKKTKGRNSVCFCTDGAGRRTHSRPEMRFPSQTFLQTSDIPPAWCTPTTTTASCPANITTVWKTSVQITAFRPPWERHTAGSQHDRLHPNTTVWSERIPSGARPVTSHLLKGWKPWGWGVRTTHHCGVQGAHESGGQHRPPQFKASNWEETQEGSKKQLVDSRRLEVKY